MLAALGVGANEPPRVISLKEELNVGLGAPVMFAT